ncbi:hypothetical protein SAMN07250955_103116 [Arboricoccus pini]|uniref:Uncharacterized protein n=1 Tax=Arboricoccus pini TaxID=1963835 RepID=A0A212QS66_9PROT|nr:hypothetical protein SAMN07250955_103116 [Arboricoccus pini]
MVFSNGLIVSLARGNEVIVILANLRIEGQDGHFDRVADSLTMRSMDEANTRSLL